MSNMPQEILEILKEFACSGEAGPEIEEILETHGEELITPLQDLLGDLLSVMDEDLWVDLICTVKICLRYLQKDL